jgi:hypothetical protein
MRSEIGVGPRSTRGRVVEFHGRRSEGGEQVAKKKVTPKKPAAKASKKRGAAASRNAKRKTMHKIK